METLFIVISISAIIVMIYAWLRVNRLRKKIPGGVAKSTCVILSEIIGLFTIGYLCVPFLPEISQNIRDVLIGIVFFFAAVFALIVINLFEMIVADLGL